MTVALGALLLVGVGALLWRSSVTTTPSSPRDGGADVAMAIESTRSAEAGVPDDPLLWGSPNPGDGGAFALASPAASVSALPPNAPKVVRFGVILVQYRGAEGAAPGARSRAEAVALARAVADAAKSDFKAQVGKGDPGSLEDAGRIPRGVLEPAIELPIFTLEKGAVSEPLDTPRGFWIVKRID